MKIGIKGPHHDLAETGKMAQDDKETRAVAWKSVAVALCTVMVGFVGHSYSQLVDRIREHEHDCEEVRVLLGKRAIEFAELKQRVSAHHMEAEYWKKIIDRLRDDVVDLRTNPKARPGAFTADDGKELSKIITNNEKNTESRLYEHEKRLDRIEQKVRDR